jgi:sporulation protein YlmC with PRC-barrel domain
MMDIPINVKVSCANDECGRSTAVIMDPTKEKITHLVVKANEAPFPERMVPISRINKTTPEEIQLNCSQEEFSKMDEFIEHHFIRTDKIYDDHLPNRYYMWPYAYPIRDHTMDQQFIDIKSEHVPQGEMAIHRGAHVQALDGRVGSVDEFMVDPDTGEITHLILLEGHLWGKKDVTIPISDVDHYDEDTVFLDLKKENIEALPSIPLHKWW